MNAVFLLSLALVAVCTAHKNAHVSANKRAQVLKLAKASFANQAALMKNSVKPTVASAKAEGLKELSNYDDYLKYDGYAMKRYRPNGDCSGKVTQQIGTAMGVCRTFTSGYGSYMLACDNSDEGYIKQREIIYHYSTDCTGSYTVYDVEALNNPSCTTIDEEGILEYGYRMIGYQCAKEYKAYPGYQTTYYTYDDCTGNALHKSTVRNGGCMIAVTTGDDDDFEDDEVPYFDYFTTSCNATTASVVFTIYADPECDSRSYGSYEYDLDEIYDNYNTCSDGGMGMCIN